MPASKKLVTALLAVCVLAPSARLAWTWREMPQAGAYHDDGVYLATAKSIAAGDGYRIASLPGQPHQTKYPPLYPALLALTWWSHPEFEGLMPRVALLSWILFAAAVLVWWRMFMSGGFSSGEAAGLAAFMALSPQMVMFGLLPLSEAPLLVVLGLALIAAERGRPIAAGLLGGAAFLTRSAALPLLVSLPAVFLWKGNRRGAAISFAAMAPAIVSWQVWSSAHAAPVSEPAALFYTSYVGLYLADMSFNQLSATLCVNLASMTGAISRLILFSEEETFVTVTLGRLFIAAIAVGAYRLVKAGRMLHYAAFSAVFVCVMALWNYPPDSRMMLPAFPMAVASILEMARHLVATIAASFRKPKRDDRIAAVVMGCLLLALGVHVADRARAGLFEFIPDVFAARAAEASGQRAALDWIRSNVPPDAGVLSYDDPMVFFRTGRRGWSFRVPPRILVRSDKDEVKQYFDTLPAFTRTHRLDYVLLTPGDYHSDSQPVSLPAFTAILSDPARYEKVYGGPAASVYRAVSAPALSSRRGP